MRGSSARAWLVGTLLTASLSPTIAVGRSEAAPSTHTWTFTASHSASTTLTVPAGVRILAPTTVNRIALRQDPPSKLIDTKSSYGGIVIRDRNGDVAYAVLRYKSYVLLVQWGQASQDGQSLPLAAGTYRVAVLGNAKTTVRLPVSGAADRSVAVSGAATVHAREYATDTFPAQTVSLPLPLKASSTFVAAAWVAGGHETVPVRYDYQYICLSKAEESGTSCVNRRGGGAGFYGVGDDVEELVHFASSTRNEGLQPGGYTANLERVNATPAESRGFITVVLD